MVHATDLISLDQPEQTLSQDLKDHANMVSIWTLVSEMIQEADDVSTGDEGNAHEKGKNTPSTGMEGVGR